MKLDLKRIAEFSRRADTEELLDRVTIFRDDMEPAALDLFEGELMNRGITRAELQTHETERLSVVLYTDTGAVARCSYCDRPAVRMRSGWYRVFWRVPVFPRLMPCCTIHAPGEASRDESD